jgi:hypothetical protein
MRRLAMLPLLVSLHGCTGGGKDDTGEGGSTDVDTDADTDTDTDVDTDTDTDTDTDAEQGPCAAGGWGQITEPTTSLHIRADGDDGGDGSIDAPLRTLAAALALTHAGDARRAIAVGPGDFEAALSLQDEVDTSGTTDSGLAIEGCGPDQTRLVGASDDAPVVEVNSATDVELTGLTLQGGERGIFSWDGATLTVTNVVVEGARGAGVVHSGGYFLGAGLEILPVTPLTLDAGLQEQLGYGFAALGGEVELVGAQITGATGAGFFAANTTVTLRDLEVRETAADSAGILGRGVHLQDECVATLEGLTLTENADAGLYSLRSFALIADDLEITAVRSADCPACDGAGTGDGIVVTAGTGGFGPETYTAALTGNVMDDAARAGVFLDGVTASMEDNVCTSCGYTSGGSALVATSTAIVSGTDTVATLSEALPSTTEPLVEPSL